MWRAFVKSTDLFIKGFTRKKGFHYIEMTKMGYLIETMGKEAKMFLFFVRKNSIILKIININLTDKLN